MKRRNRRRQLGVFWSPREVQCFSCFHLGRGRGREREKKKSLSLTSSTFQPNLSHLLPLSLLLPLFCASPIQPMNIKAKTLLSCQRRSREKRRKKRENLVSSSDECHRSLPFLPLRRFPPPPLSGPAIRFSADVEEGHRS